MLVSWEFLTGSSRKTLRRCGYQTPQGNVKPRVQTEMFASLFKATIFQSSTHGKNGEN
jgi:hypothetical protein